MLTGLLCVAVETSSQLLDLGCLVLPSQVTARLRGVLKKTPRSFPRKQTFEEILAQFVEADEEMPTVNLLLCHTDKDTCDGGHCLLR